MTTADYCSDAMIAERTAPLRAKLANHRLYAQIRTAKDLCHFMESHVFAVWDFMSLLKALQAKLTCVTVPWRPTEWPESRRFVNELVLGEESDLFEGRSVSHFELYRDAMSEAGANTSAIDSLLASLPAGRPFDVGQIAAPEAARRFVASTFLLIGAEKPHEMAAAFTFGREDLIPEMFRSLVRDLNAQFGGRYAKLIWYLERHIDVDGEDHGPIALKMVSDLCADDPKLWAEAAAAAEAALNARLELWNGILAELGE
jgi:hypothetical protein